MKVATKMNPSLHLKSKIKDVGLSSYRIYNKKAYRYENLSRKEYDAFVNLSNNKDLLVQKADCCFTSLLIIRNTNGRVTFR